MNPTPHPAEPTLFYSPGACSLAPHIVASEAGLKISLNKVAFGEKRTTEDGRDPVTRLFKLADFDEQVEAVRIHLGVAFQPEPDPAKIESLAFQKCIRIQAGG